MSSSGTQSQKMICKDGYMACLMLKELGFFGLVTEAKKGQFNSSIHLLKGNRAKDNTL